MKWWYWYSHNGVPHTIASAGMCLTCPDGRQHPLNVCNLTVATVHTGNQSTYYTINSLRGVYAGTVIIPNNTVDCWDALGPHGRHLDANESHDLHRCVVRHLAKLAVKVPGS